MPIAEQRPWRHRCLVQVTRGRLMRLSSSADGSATPSPPSSRATWPPASPAAGGPCCAGSRHSERLRGITSRQVKGGRPRWTDEENAFILTRLDMESLELYRAFTEAGLARTRSAIQGRLHALRKVAGWKPDTAPPDREPWSPEEVAFLQAHLHEKTRELHEQLVAAGSRHPLSSVRGKLHSLRKAAGVEAAEVPGSRPEWTPEEPDSLRERLDGSAKETWLEYRARGYIRTKHAVATKIREMRLETGTTAKPGKGRNPKWSAEELSFLRDRLDGQFQEVHAEFKAAGFDRSRMGARRKFYGLREEVGFKPEGPTGDEAVWTEPELEFLRGRLEQPAQEVIDAFLAAGHDRTRKAVQGRFYALRRQAGIKSRPMAGRRQPWTDAEAAVLKELLHLPFTMALRMFKESGFDRPRYSVRKKFYGLREAEGISRAGDRRTGRSG